MAAPTIEPITSPSDNYEQANKLFQTGVILIYGQRKSIDKAIKCIQKAITLNDADYKYWQILGEAYYQRGSLNPAINSFMRSLRLVGDSNQSTRDQGQDEAKKKREFADCIYSRLRMSDIRLSVGHLEEAIKGYSDIIICDPNNVAAVVGLAKAQLQSAQNNFSAGLVKLGHSQCIYSLKNSLKAIKLCPHLCITWKLASDCCLMQFIHGQRGHFVAHIKEQFPGSNDENIIVLDRTTCIKLAIQFLCKAIDNELFTESGCLWHNLGVSLYLQSTIGNKSVEREILLRRSMKCLLKALDYDRNSSQVKNSIGVVAFNLNLFNVGQNYIIKSIQTNMSTSEVQFSNLGYMYLQKGEFRLASVAFSRCQAEEPLYARSWLGNALISEQNNMDNLSNLRHCHKLIWNFESQLLFATKVACLSNNEQYKKDLINALDCMKRIINYDSNSLEANTTLGLLLEKYGHFNQSKFYLDKAHDASPQDTRSILNKLRRTKISQSCFAIDDPSSSNEEVNFIKSAEKMCNVGDCDKILNFLYYLFNNGDFRKVNQRMTRYMQMLPEDDIKNKVCAQILLGLAARAEKGDFKSWLFKNVIDLGLAVSIESNINTLCLMLFGAQENDMPVLNETSTTIPRHILAYISSRGQQFTDVLASQEGYWLRLAILSSIFCFKNQRKLIMLLTTIFPTIPEFWLYLGIAHIFDKKQHQTALFCIKKASLIGSTRGDLVTVCDILLSILTQSQQVKLDAKETRINYLSRALYKSPNYGLLWRSLLIAKESNNAQKSQSQSIFNDQNSSLFYLALDLTLNMMKG